MAMLAEPRRKIRYCVNPNGSNWRQQAAPAEGEAAASATSSSSSHFGERLMASMGWREGQGLGKSGQGIQEPIRVKRKSDQRGVGCTGVYAAETMPQNDDFASLLAALNAEHSTASGQQAEAAVVGLEAKSKASRARLHYHRFTRGKDVSAYDAKSLACIFGRSETEATTMMTHSNSDGCLRKLEEKEVDDEAPKPDEDEAASSKHGLQLVQSQTSLQDYFKAKMRQMEETRRLAAAAAAVAAAADEASWTSESSCSAASTLTDGTPAAPAAGGPAVEFSLPPLSPEALEAEVDSERTDDADAVVVDFRLFPGSEFQRVLGYPHY